MKKIRKIKFINHPRLKNLELNFCDKNNKAVDTIIIAGENGTCKSTVLNCLYKIVTRKIDFEAIVELEENNQIYTVEYFYKEINKNQKILFVRIGNQEEMLQLLNKLKSKCDFNGIFSDVDINFKAKSLNTVTSLTLDSDAKSQRSTESLPEKIKQLIIDIQALDDAEVSKTFREYKENNQDSNQIEIEERMPRFTNAFSKIFDSLKYDRVDNINGHKEIIFKKNGDEIYIDDLSSGEKQIVYRGCFLLKDQNALKNPLVFIDEPEISLHPMWQKKILNYYKDIYTNKEGIQTSQIFVVTHSPFIIHNESRTNDKVIVMKRESNDNIVVIDRPEYYRCNSIETVEDAFNMNNLLDEIQNANNVVFVEGRTDEIYFNKAMDVFKINNQNIKFKWIGYLDANGKESNTGYTALNSAAQFLHAYDNKKAIVLLYDCDTNKKISKENNVIVMGVPEYNNSKRIKKGIENALCLDNFDLTPYYTEKQIYGDYGELKKIHDFEKMKLCNYICSMDDEEKLKEILCNLNDVIENIINELSN